MNSPADLVIINCYTDQVIDFDSILLKPNGNLVILSRNHPNQFSELITFYLISNGFNFIERIQLSKLKEPELNNLANKLRDDGHWLRFSKSKISYCKMPKSNKNIWIVSKNICDDWFEKIIKYLCPESGNVCEIGKEENVHIKNVCKEIKYEFSKRRCLEVERKNG